MRGFLAGQSIIPSAPSAEVLLPRDRERRGPSRLLRFPLDPAHWFERGRRALARGALDEAGRDLDLALEAAPDDPVILNARAQVHMARGQAHRALALLERACELRPGVAALHGNRAVALLALGRVDESEAAFHRALELSPSDPDILHSHALALLQRGEFQRALADLDQVVTARPERGEAWRHKALVHVNLFQLREARQAFLHAGRRLWAEGGSKREAALLVLLGASLRLFVRAGLGEPPPLPG